jgi:hypothetical protein
MIVPCFTLFIPRFGVWEGGQCGGGAVGFELGVGFELEGVGLEG